LTWLPIKLGVLLKLTLVLFRSFEREKKFINARVGGNDERKKKIDADMAGETRTEIEVKVVMHI